MSGQPPPSADPIYESSLRELKWILVIWLINFTWVVGYCAAFGYQSGERPLTTVLGMPAWVFWGVFLPWILAAAVSSWFALTQIKDHPLDEPPSPDTQEPSDG